MRHILHFHRKPHRMVRFVIQYVLIGILPIKVGSLRTSAGDRGRQDNVEVSSLYERYIRTVESMFQSDNTHVFVCNVPHEDGRTK